MVHKFLFNHDSAHVLSNISNWWTSFLDFISPRQCVACGRRLSPTERTLCTVCMLHLPRTNFQLTPADNPMAQLFWHLVPIERAAALFFYEPHSEIARVIYLLKYAQRPDIGEDMGRLMANDMLHAQFFHEIDYLIPVPLTRKRLHQRGYNQSEQLSRGISQITGIPINTEVLVRRHFQQSQTQLSRQQRQTNVEGTFALKNATSLKHKHILLIDDICTTGATLLACATTLRDIEGIRISVLTLGFTKG